MTNSIGTLICRKKKFLSSEDINEICYAFQEAALESLISRVLEVSKKLKIKKIVAGGGVVVNKRLRQLFQNTDLKTFFPRVDYCGDNAAMVAGLGFRMYNKGVKSDIDFGPYSIFEEKWKENMFIKI